jgi:RES domain-containing protein
VTRRAWRICKKRYAGSAFDGEGARLHGSRWTSPGTRVAFASETLSLATLEVLVHLGASAPLSAYCVFTVGLPDDLVEAIEAAALPSGWRAHPVPGALRALGDAWIREGRSAALQVPSSIVTHEHNYLINPAHEGFRRIEIKGPEPLDIDPRVLRGRS